MGDDGNNERQGQVPRANMPPSLPAVSCPPRTAGWSFTSPAMSPATSDVGQLPNPSLLSIVCPLQFSREHGTGFEAASQSVTASHSLAPTTTSTSTSTSTTPAAPTWVVSQGSISQSHVNPLQTFAALQALPPLVLGQSRPISFSTMPNAQNAQAVQRGASSDSLILQSPSGSQSAYLDGSTVPGEKRNSRRFKSREASRACRKKTKEYVQCLEHRVVVLERQNQQLIDEIRTVRDLYADKGQRPCPQ